MPVPTRIPPRTAATALALAAVGAVAAAAAAPLPARAAEGIQRVSVGPRGAQADGTSRYPAISADGRVVAFQSFATNLVPGDTNSRSETDVFVHDRATGRTERVSVGPGGVQADGTSYDSPAVSADGRFVAFGSEATNLVPGDTNGRPDVFVRDRETGRTERASVGPGGRQGNGLSVAPALSADGRYIAFLSAATNLVPGDTNGQTDVFVRDRRTGRTTRVSVGPRGAQGDGAAHLAPALSADGRVVAFTSGATNLVPGDTNGTEDVFVRDRLTGATTRVSVGPGGTQGLGGYGSISPAISADGRLVAFRSDDTNLVPGDTNGAQDVFVHDRKTRTTERVSVGPRGVQADGTSFGPVAISADGQHVAFGSYAGNLVPGDTNWSSDVFVRNRRTGVTRRASVGPGGVHADEESGSPSLSADGRLVAFQSLAANLVPGDTNGHFDIFVRTRR